MREQCEQMHIFGNPSSSFRTVNEMDHRAHLDKEFSNMKCQKAKLDESSVPRLEDEAAEVPHVLAEPKADNVIVDGVLSLGKENSWKHLEIEDFYYGFDYVINRNCGGLDCNTQGQDELEFGVLDGLLDEVDEIDDFLAPNDISGACEDFLLDIELADKKCKLEYAPSGRSRVENSSSESQSPGLSGSSNGVLGLSESSSATLLESECKNVSAEKKSVKCELYDSPEDYINYQTLGGDHEITTLDLENLDDLDDAMHSDSDISSNEKEKKAVQKSKMGTLLGQRRLRRPTKRYMDEFSARRSKNALETGQGLDTDLKDECLNVISPFELHHPKESLSETITQEPLEVEDDEKLSDLKSKCLTRRRKISYSAPTIKRIKIVSRNEHHQFKSSKSTSLDESTTGTSQEPCNSRPLRGRQKKLPSVSVFDSDDGHSESDSEDDHVKRRSKKSGDRRKHQRMWTLSEVTKLIDGIAQYGTGRWTDIKKLSFSSSAYRTPIDLRDKWRNLLRASSAHKQKLKQNKEDEDEQQHAIRSLPKTVIRRIRELAVIHPYPRFTPGGRYIRRKN